MNMLSKSFILSAVLFAGLCQAQRDNFPIAEISPNGKHILVCNSKDLSFRLYESASGKLVKEIPTGFSRGGARLGGRLPDVIVARFSQNGDYLYIGFNEKYVVWDMVNNKLTRELNKFIFKNFTLSAFNKNQPIKLNVSDQAIYKLQKKHKSNGASVNFSQDGQLVVLKNDYPNYNKANLVDLASGKLLKTFSINDIILGYGFDQKTKFFIGASVGDENAYQLRIWDVASGQLLDSLSNCYNPRLSKKNTLLTLSSNPDNPSEDANENTAKIWDVETRKLLHLLSGHSQKLSNAEFSEDGKLVATSSFDGRIIVWNAESGERRFSFDSDSGAAVIVYGFDHQGKIIVYGDGNGEVHVWDINTGVKKFTIK